MPEHSDADVIGEWPGGSRLTLKRYINGRFEAAFLLDTTPPLKLHVGNHFTRREGHDLTIDYPSMEALLLDGWMVD